MKKNNNTIICTNGNGLTVDDIKELSKFQEYRRRRASGFVKGCNKCMQNKPYVEFNYDSDICKKCLENNTLSNDNATN